MDATTEPWTRSQLQERDTWNLKGLYASANDWQADCIALESQLGTYASFAGTLGTSAARLKACLEFDTQLSRTLESIYTYAHLRNDEDKTHTGHQAEYEKATQLLTRYQQACSFINPELMNIPEATMRDFLNDPELEFFKYHIEKQLRFREHTLSEKEEALLAASSEMARTPQNVFGMLDNTDLNLGQIEDAEKRTVQITHGNFQSLLQNYDRRIRRETFESVYKSYEQHQYTFTALLDGSLKKDMFYARARNYPSVREQALFTENIPVTVYDQLIETVHNNLEPLYKYFAIRKRRLKLDELHIYDCSVPLVENIKWDMNYEKAVITIGEALAPLGEDYVATVTQGLLENRWVDRYECKGKRSGAYSSGCYDSNPFILMNYMDDNINSVYTLAHEAGHSMHSHFSKSHQEYLYADYTIFVAEVASTFNEALLTRYFLNQDIGPDMKIYLLCREIDNFRGTLFRQTMFAEFERDIYTSAEAGNAMTVDSFKDIYNQLLMRYFGSEVTLDPCLALECFRIPHFYFGFYVYKYATGISAAYALAERVTKGGDADLADYLNFLQSGGSKYPIDLLKGAGVDMSSPKPVATALKKFKDLVDELETLAP
ncbi:MAG: oligoendopeptidase F [Nitrospina sp.]|nr:MAG: oligoendopeptidase F [Nitrospina sp.]